MTVLGQCCSNLPRHRKLIFNDQDSHGFIGNFGRLEADGKLCSEQMVVLARSGGFMLETVLQLQLRVRGETVGSGYVDSAEVWTPMSFAAVAIIDCVE